MNSLRLFCAVVILEALIFCFAATMHLGLRLRVGPLVLELGRILPATIVEGTCAVVFTATAYALFTRRAWTWTVALTAILFSLAGVLVGLSIIATGGGPYKGLNLAYHGVMLVLALAGLTLMLQPAVRAALKTSPYHPETKVSHA
jgi:hypothetical protein